MISKLRPLVEEDVLSYARHSPITLKIDRPSGMERTYSELYPLYQYARLEVAFKVGDDGHITVDDADENTILSARWICRSFVEGIYKRECNFSDGLYDVDLRDIALPRLKMSEIFANYLCFETVDGLVTFADIRSRIEAMIAEDRANAVESTDDPDIEFEIP